MIHPRLKQPMRLVDHLCFAAEHDDHHLGTGQRWLGKRSQVIVREAGEGRGRVVQALIDELAGSKHQ